MTAERMRARVEGFVQGVGFRYFVLREAQALGLTGWVANTRDGSVEIVAEGPPAALDELQARLDTGPSSSSVRVVHAVRGDATGEFERFDVRL